MTFLHMYYVDWNEYFMPRVQPSLRLCGPLSTSGVGAGRHLWPMITLLNGLSTTPPPPQQHFEAY